MALDRLAEFLARVGTIEPTAAESFFAAEIEVLAQRQGVALDSGESQLCAVVVTRSIPWLLTGDKRAIRGLQQLLELDGRFVWLKKKIVCLEHLILGAALGANANLLRSKICAEPHVDKALTICFSCNSSESAEWTAGLVSYIGALKTEANEMLSD